VGPWANDIGMEGVDVAYHCQACGELVGPPIGEEQVRTVGFALTFTGVSILTVFAIVAALRFVTLFSHYSQDWSRMAGDFLADHFSFFRSDADIDVDLQSVTLSSTSDGLEMESRSSQAGDEPDAEKGEG